MSGIVLIDSSAWLSVLGPRPVPEVRRRVEVLINENAAATTSPIIFELLSYPLAEGRIKNLAEFLSGLHVYPFAPADWLEAAEWVSSLRAKGCKTKTVDSLIGFVAKKYKLTLLHADADLDRLSKWGHFPVESHVVTVRRWTGES